MLPKRQLKCVCKLPHVAQSTAASSPSYYAVFPNTRKLLGNHQLAKAKKGLWVLPFFPSPDRPIRLGSVATNGKQGCSMTKAGDYRGSFKGLWVQGLTGPMSWCMLLLESFSSVIRVTEKRGFR